MKRSRQPGRRRRGFTLLELLLALGLSVLLLSAIGMAIDLHLRLLQSGRAEVEQAQLARAVLRKIADDLRSAVQYQSTTKGASSSNGGSTTTADSIDGTGGFTDGMMDDSSADRTSNLVDAESLPTVPGIYGNDRQLQVDTSRLPRLDQLRSLLSAEEMFGSDRMSDIRNVLYFHSNSSPSVESISPLGQENGLMRRDRDRAEALQSFQQGDTIEASGDEELLAPEVTDIQFRYFDGSEWLDQWDSTEQNGLPVAVEVTVWLPRAKAASGGLGMSSAATADLDEENEQAYQLVVHLPVAKPTSQTSTDQSATSQGGTP